MSSSTERVAIGVIGRPHGLDGTVVLNPDTDDDGRFQRGSKIWVGDVERVLLDVRITDGPLLVRLDGISDRSSAESIRGLVVTIHETERRELDPDEFWPDQLIGLDVLDSTGRRHGHVIGVVQPGTQDRIEVQTDSGVVEIPFVAALIESVDLESGVIRTAPVEDLFTPR